MFGKKSNKFLNWRDKEQDLNEVSTKAKEIRAKLENDRSKALVNIEKSKAKQIKTQNKNENIQVESLKPGTKVYVTIEG